MQPARVIESILLALTVVFGLVLMFSPLGASWVDTADGRDTETFSMFSKERESTDRGEEATGDGTSIQYLDGAFDGRGGSTYLRLMGPAMAVGVFLTLIAFILTVIPATSDSVAGGLLAVPGAILAVMSIVMVVLGTSMAAADLLPGAPQVDFFEFPTAIAVMLLITATIGAGMGVVPTRNVTTVEEHVYTPAGASGWVAGRNLRCPECSTVVTAGYGVVPICPTCGFGSDYDGPASPPVPVTPVGQ